MKTQISLIKNKEYFSIGWFKGEPFKLIDITLFENIQDDMIVIFSLQIIKFMISFGFYLK